MVSISFKQYLILKKLYKARPDSVQLDNSSNDFEFLLDQQLISSNHDILNAKNDFIIGSFTTPNGISTITNKGEAMYNSYFDTYLNRVGVIISLIISVIALMVSIFKP